jgi:hypothetical protein
MRGCTGGVGGGRLGHRRREEVEALRSRASQTALRNVPAGQSRQKAAGVDTVTNTLLRRVFDNGQAASVQTVLLPLAQMCLTGTVHPHAMDILQAGRLVLTPKTDGEQQAPQKAPARHAYAQLAQGRQAKQQAPSVDFRPLGIGGSCA